MNAMGYRVSPLEVEHCLSRHPAVAEVAVTELAVREGVSIIAAFVSLDGETNWLEGVLLVALYLILAVAFFFLPTMPGLAH